MILVWTEGAHRRAAFRRLLEEGVPDFASAHFGRRDGTAVFEPYSAVALWWVIERLMRSPSATAARL